MRARPEPGRAPAGFDGHRASRSVRLQLSCQLRPSCSRQSDRRTPSPDHACLASLATCRTTLRESRRTAGLQVDDRSPHGCSRSRAWDGPEAIALVRSTSTSNSASRSGARSAIATRWRSTVAASPRATGPVSAALPSAPQFSTLARISGNRIVRSCPVLRIRSSAASSIVTRKFDAIEAAAW